MESLAMNHCFIDGNKRIAFFATEPGSESKTFPTSSTFGERKPVERFNPIDQLSFGAMMTCQNGQKIVCW